MAFRFKPGDIKRTCGFRAYQRGMNYWKENRVLDIQLTDESATQQIVSRVSGSHGNIYTTQIEILEYPDGDCEIIGECTCPVQIDCKHIAATLLQTLHEGPQALTVNNDDMVDEWLESLKQASQKTTSEHPPTTASPFRLLYILESNPEHHDPYALQLTTQKVRLLKKGGYGKPSAFPLEKANETYYANDFLAPIDRDISQLITNARNYYYFNYTNQYTLKREMGELALKKMLQTGRCHWGDKDNPPLTLGAPRPATFEWRNIADGGRQLETEIDPPVNAIFRIDGFWYIDLETLQAGPLQHADITCAQFEALLKAPLIPASKLEDVSRKITLELPEYSLEAPAEIDLKTIDITGQSPTPVLTLRRSDSAGRHCAQLAFDYGPVTATDSTDQTITQVLEGNTLYRIHRHPEAEQQAFATLRQLGLEWLTLPDSPNMEWAFPPHIDLAETARQWDHFIEYEKPRLTAEGWHIDFDDSFTLRFEESEDWHGDLEADDNDWFSLSLGVEVDGQRVDLLPWLLQILRRSGDPAELRTTLASRPTTLLELDAERFLKIPTERLLPIFDTLVELYDLETLDPDGALPLSRQQVLQLNHLLNNPHLNWRGADEMLELAQRLQDFSGITPVETPPGFQATLRDYQIEGLSWLQFLREYELHGILADDMGLGKTIQTLAHLLTEKQAGRMDGPALIIAPTSLVGNWRREAETFAPDLDVLILQGKDRHYDFHRIPEYDLVITSYPLIRRDRDILAKIDFYMIVLDEAQYIKNPKSVTTQTVFELTGRYRLCLSGTPVENHLGEFWSIFHFLMPGFLGTQERFNRLFRHPIEKQQDDIRRDQLNRRVRPFLLRRTKDQVASELPEKTEIIRSVTLTGKQRDLYESIRLAMDKKVRDEISKKGLARSHITILDALLKLRQVCCDPRLVSLPRARAVKRSAKLELLMELLPEMIEEGRKVLVFSQFTTMLGLIEEALKERGIDYSKLTGQTRKREAAIAKFQQGSAPVFLISLKAGGVGLNLTAADTVIHYDPWWNPAVENQATDRAHRIGQDKAVFVYKLITEDTVEDRILAMQGRKQALAEAIYDRPDGGGILAAEDLTELFRPLDDTSAKTE